MINIIRNKLLKNSNSKLSIEELNILYGLDCDFIDELVECRYKRDKYEDFCFIFDKNNVACTPLNINENTICYIGDLIIDKVLPTYNLKYIYGNLNNSYGLDCLKKIGGSAFFNNLEDSNGLINLEEIGDYADFESLESAKGLENLKYIGGLINFKNLLTVDDLKKLEDRIILDMYIRMKNKIKSMKKVLVRK